MEPYAGVRAQYVEFGEHADDSPCFVEWSAGVAGDPEVLALDRRPAGHQEAAQHRVRRRALARRPGPGPYAGLRDALLADDGAIRATILERSTQTNEVGRLATLLPAFASLVPTGPIALIEAGASAGLNLFPDRWGYSWSTADGVVELGPAPYLPCEVTGPAPLPSRAARDRLARRRRPQPARRHRPGRDGVARDPGVARAGRPPRAAAARGLRRPGRPAAARRAATSSTSCRRSSPRPAGTARSSCSTARWRRTSRSSTVPRSRS